MLDDLGETIDCPNCGRPNPGWAQVCRNCGFSLRRGLARSVGKPERPFPTDQASLLSIGAAVGSDRPGHRPWPLLLGAESHETNGRGIHRSDALPCPELLAVRRPGLLALGGTRVESASPTPALPATISFGTGLNSSKQVTGKTDTFGPNSYFAHSVAQAKAAFGVSKLYETVVRVAEDGTETPVQTRYPVNVSATAKNFGFVVSTNSLLRDWGAGGTFVMRIYKGDSLIAQGQFSLSAN